MEINEYTIEVFSKMSGPLTGLWMFSENLKTENEFSYIQEAMFFLLTQKGIRIFTPCAGDIGLKKLSLKKSLRLVSNEKNWARPRNTDDTIYFVTVLSKKEVREQVMSPEPLEIALDKVRNYETLLNFMNALSIDFENRNENEKEWEKQNLPFYDNPFQPNDWESYDAGSYLEACVAFGESFDAAEIKKDNPWKVMAHLLWCGKMYE